MAIKLIEVHNRKTGGRGHIPERALPRYRSKGWLPVYPKPESTESPAAVSAGEPAEGDKARDRRSESAAANPKKDKEN